MSKKNMRVPIGIAIIALILLVVLFSVRGTLTHPVHVVLPEENAAENSTDGQGGDVSSSIARIEVTPSTVQSAIATLKRPEQYSSSFTVERFYGEDSLTETGTLYVSAPWSRIDLAKSGEVRHVLTDGETVHIWYGSSKKVYTSTAAFSADEEQGVPTYEDVLALNPESIALADYRLLDITDCIYVETAADEAGYVERYWVSVSTGLLISAEKQRGDEVIYRYTSSDLNTAEVTLQQFTLPDGTVLKTIEE